MSLASLKSLCSLAMAFMLPTATLMATSSGITGRSLSSTPGCGTSGCHGTSNNATTISIKEAVDGVINVIPNERITLTLTISNANMVAAGMNLSVRTSSTGGIRVGTLDNNGDQGIRVMQGEITQSTPRTLTDGVAEFTFGWVSPVTTGEYYIHATGNAVNRNGSAEGGDRWNFMTPVKIVVSGTASVQEADVAHGAISIAPVPAHGSMVLTAPTTPGEEVTIQILDAVGAVIRSVTTSSNDDQLIFVWDGRTSNGSEAAPGTYTVAIIGERRVSTGRAMIVR
ncbi:MAG: hypothetical protein EHM43_03790 [Ignavibacteriae bacterium]|nr:MAG: hypothetical protein EHM43_03790 [Ignavibacteriota bacterium]